MHYEGMSDFACFWSTVDKIHKAWNKGLTRETDPRVMAFPRHYSDKLSIEESVRQRKLTQHRYYETHGAEIRKKNEAWRHSINGQLKKKRYVETHRGQLRINARKWARNNRGRVQQLMSLRRLQAIESMGGRCENCGEKNPIVLEFDHIVPIFNSTRRRGANEAPRSIIFTILRGEDIGLQLLCANCHRKKTHEEYRQWFEEGKFLKAVA